MFDNSTKALRCEGFEHQTHNDNANHRLPVRASGTIEGNAGIIPKAGNGLSCLHMDILFATRANQARLVIGFLCGEQTKCVYVHPHS
jgi:hypothetical protein